MALLVLSEKVGALEVLTYLVACSTSREALLVDPGGPAPALAARSTRKAGGCALSSTPTATPIISPETILVRPHRGAGGHASPGLGVLQPAGDAGPGPGGRLFAPHPGGPAGGRWPPPAPGDWQVKVLHTPGHTPGAICLSLPGHLFTGDTLFVEAAGRTDLPGGSLDALVRSLQEKSCPSRMTPASGRDMTMAARPPRPSGKKSSTTPTSPIFFSARITSGPFHQRRARILVRVARQAPLSPGSV